MKLTSNFPLIKLDTSIISRVFENMINFALSNVSVDGLVEIESYKDDDNIYISFHDYGIQLPTDYGDQMFDKFTQLEIKNEGYRIGRGLAMTFCKLAVEAHGGRLTIDKENKTGNKFIISFPVK